MIAKGFAETASKADIKGLEGRMDNFAARMGNFEKRLDHTDARVGRIEADISEMKGNIVYKYEFEDLQARVKYVETKLGIESGK